MTRQTKKEIKKDIETTLNIKLSNKMFNSILRDKRKRKRKAFCEKHFTAILISLFFVLVCITMVTSELIISYQSYYYGFQIPEPTSVSKPTNLIDSEKFCVEIPETAKSIEEENYKELVENMKEIN